MTVASDSRVTGGHSNASGSRIVIAGDRTGTRALAQRHSGRVRLLKVLLPTSAIVSIVACAAGIINGMSLSAAISAIPVPQIVADNLKMQNPHYEGFNADGGRYWVKAKTAQQDLKAIGIIKLDTITGVMTDVKKQNTNLEATRGTYDQKSGLLELFESIKVRGDNGMTADLTRASIKTKENIITSDEPSKVTMPTGQITSKQLTVRQKTKEYTFLEDVKTHLTPKAPAAGDTTDSAAKPLPFGKPGEPIDVASNRLDIDDVKKTAIFSGDVVADQAGSTLKAPGMTVTYEGAVAPAGSSDKTAQTDASEGTKVKQIIVDESVELQQPSGETATSRSAVFDAENKTAVLVGDVVLTQGADKRATGDRADYDETAQTLVLTGPVVVTQGENILHGRKLVYERTTSKMHLTSPLGSGAGRISAHFIKPNAKAAAQPAEDEQSTDGIAFGSAFKTDPTAPYDVNADRLDVDDAKKAAVFTGNVIAVQGGSTMKAAEMTAFYTGSAALSTPADGAKGETASLKHITAKRQVSITSKDGQTATGDWAEVDVKSNLATLGGGAVTLVQGNNVVKGTKVLINLTTGEATVKTEPPGGAAGAMVSSSDGDGGGPIIKATRPSAIFYPGQMSKKPKITADDVKVDGWQSKTSP